jgi:hypothetical protein
MASVLTDVSPIVHVWDALDCVQQRVPCPANIEQLRTAIEEEWDNIPQATINNLINSMRRRGVALHEENGASLTTEFQTSSGSKVSTRNVHWEFHEIPPLPSTCT